MNSTHTHIHTLFDLQFYPSLWQMRKEFSTCKFFFSSSNYIYKISFSTWFSLDRFSLHMQMLVNQHTRLLHILCWLLFRANANSELFYKVIYFTRMMSPRNSDHLQFRLCHCLQQPNGDLDFLKYDLEFLNLKKSRSSVSIFAMECTLYFRLLYQVER